MRKAALGPWVVAPITMAATPADPAGGGDGGCAASLTRTTTAEVSADLRLARPRAILYHLSERYPPNWHFGQNGDTRTPRGGAGGVPTCPRRPHILRAQKHTPITPPAPLVGMPSSHVDKFSRSILCSRCFLGPFYYFFMPTFLVLKDKKK